MREWDLFANFALLLRQLNINNAKKQNEHITINHNSEQQTH